MTNSRIKLLLGQHLYYCFCFYTITQHEWAKNTSTNLVKSLAFSLSVLTFHISS